MRTTVSPATAAAAALPTAQGFARVVHPVVAVPVGDTYSVVAWAGCARVSAPRSTVHEPRTLLCFVGSPNIAPPGFPARGIQIPFRTDQWAPRRLKAAVAQSATPVACV